MNESNQSQGSELSEAWNRAGESVNRAAELYLKELADYLNWARDLQREILEQNLATTRKFSQWSEAQLAFLARLRESIPAIGTVPKGTETVAGMVDAVVRATGPAE